MYLLPACSGRRMVAGDAGPPNPQCNDHHRDHSIIREVVNIWLVIFGKTKSSNWLEAKILDSDWSMLDLPICNAMIIITIIGSSERSSIFGDHWIIREVFNICPVISTTIKMPSSSRWHPKCQREADFAERACDKCET